MVPQRASRPLIIRPRERFSFRAVNFLLAGGALMWLAVGIGAFWSYLRADGPSFLLCCGVMVSAAALVQGWLVVRAARRPPDVWSTQRFVLFFAPWLFLGTLASYATAVTVGPGENASLVYRATLACWYTLGLAPWLATPELISRSIRRPWWRRAALAMRLAVASGLFVMAGEMALRLREWITDRRAEKIANLASAKLQPGTNFRGRPVNRQGYWDEDFDMLPRDRRFRVAVLGHGLTLSGSAETNCLVQMERRVSGLEIYNFGIATARPRDFAAHLEAEVAAYHPDLLLAVICVGDDLTFRAPVRGPYDWQSFRLAQAASRLLGLAPSSPQAANGWANLAKDDFEGYLRLVSPQLAVCRKSADESTKGQWQRVLHHLDILVREARARRIPVALVLVPGEFQVRPELCRVLARRVGWSEEQIDVDLPHRRLATFAQQRDVPLLDLLPYFRASCESPYCRNRPELNDVGHQIATTVVGGWLESRCANFVASSANRGKAL